MKIACSLQYNGAAFSGFQVQKNERTVQGEVERALEIYFRRPMRVHCAGRTDTGVHAMGQVIHFELPDEAGLGERELEQAIYSLNCIMPDDVGIIYGGVVDENFHARFSCRGREYCYRFALSPYKMPLYKGSHYWVRGGLDVGAMREGAAFLVGEHDFKAFTRKIYERLNEPTVRRIDSIRVIEAPPLLYLYFAGSGFLHNMIRIISGTLLKVGRCEIEASDVERILHGGDRVDAGVTLPPHPLVFLNASYENYATPRELIPFYRHLDSTP